jgi:peptidoglycan-associated lipoprotein
MRIKQLAVGLFTCFLVVNFSGCTTHKKPLHRVGVVDANNRYGGAGGNETYSEGMGLDRDSYPESSKCRPGRSVAHAEQHYFFDFDSYEVRQEAMDSIQMQANYLVKHPGSRIRLEGNTDDRGSREYNVALGEKRARAVLDVLKQYGVSVSQVTVVSYGAEKPAAGGEDEKSYQCNRRVDLIYCD